MEFFIFDYGLFINIYLLVFRLFRKSYAFFLYWSGVRRFIRVV